MTANRLDLREVDAALDALAVGPIAESLARRMLVSGGQIVRDEAKARAPVSEPPYNPNSRGSQSPGTLADAIYLSKFEEGSGAAVFSYKISWNAKQAWWGKLWEFGWWQKYRIGYDKDRDVFYTDTSDVLPTPIRHAKPFLAPAYEASSDRAFKAMVARGRVELPQLLREKK